MKKCVRSIALRLPVVFWLLSIMACSQTSLEPVAEVSVAPVQKKIAMKPVMQLQKQGKRLQLVRMMEGGACKNIQQGVAGVFLVYADPEASETIKATQGDAVFVDFERQIEVFSTRALQSALVQLDFNANPFAFDEADRAEKLASDLERLFIQAVQADVEAFEQQTEMLIEVRPLLDSLQFYLDDCGF